MKPPASGVHDNPFVFAAIGVCMGLRRVPTGGVPVGQQSARDALYQMGGQLSNGVGGGQMVSDQLMVRW